MNNENRYDLKENNTALKIFFLSFYRLNIIPYIRFYIIDLKKLCCVTVFLTTTFDPKDTAVEKNG